MPPVGTGFTANVLLPFGYVLGVIRIIIIVVLGVVHVLVEGACLVLVSNYVSLITGWIRIIVLQVPDTSIVSHDNAFFNLHSCATGASASWDVVDPRRSCDT